MPWTRFIGTLVLGALALTACGPGSPTPTASPTPIGSPTPTGSPMPTGLPAPKDSAPPRPPVDRRPTTTTTGPTPFSPVGSSFINSEVGWVLGSGGCPSCAVLEVTRDGGSTWTALPEPPVALADGTGASGAVTDVYFADEDNGFLFGPGLEVTHDGGRTWTDASLPPTLESDGGDADVLAETSIIEMAGGDGYGYAVAETSNDDEASLWRTTVGSNRWSPLPLPPSSVMVQQANGTFQLSVEGSTLLLLQRGFSGPDVSGVEVGTLWMSMDAGARWLARPIPCSPEDGGAAAASMAWGHPDAWLVDCYDNEQSQQAQDTRHHLYGSADAGAHWVRLADPTRTGEPDLLADNGAGHAFLTTESGGADNLDATFDGGLHWSTLFDPGGSFDAWADLEFVDSATGFVVGPTDMPPKRLYRTDDGGLTWRVLPLR